MLTPFTPYSTKVVPAINPLLVVGRYVALHVDLKRFMTQPLCTSVVARNPLKLAQILAQNPGPDAPDYNHTGNALDVGPTHKTKVCLTFLSGTPTANGQDFPLGPFALTIRSRLLPDAVPPDR
jgi:hypothetical protein